MSSLEVMVDEKNICENFEPYFSDLRLCEKLNEDVTIFNANCSEVFKCIKSQSVDLILTDPPYNLGAFMHKRNTNLIKMRDNQFAYAGWDNLSYEEWLTEMDNFFDDSGRGFRFVYEG